MASNTLDSGKTTSLFMVMEWCKATQLNILDNLEMDSKIFMEDKYKREKYTRDSLWMGEEKDRESDIHKMQYNKAYLTSIWFRVWLSITMEMSMKDS